MESRVHEHCDKTPGAVVSLERSKADRVIMSKNTCFYPRAPLTTSRHYSPNARETPNIIDKYRREIFDEMRGGRSSEFKSITN